MSLPTLLHRKSVEQFFQAANWEGRSKEIQATLPKEAGLSLCLNVGEFFSRHNWEGKPSILTTETVVVEEVVITRTVKEFFAYLSWEGKPQVAKMSTIGVKKTPSLDSESGDLNLNDLSDLF